jgi:hypothetical protein
MKTEVVWCTELTKEEFIDFCVSPQLAINNHPEIWNYDREVSTIKQLLNLDDLDFGGLSSVINRLTGLDGEKMQIPGMYDSAGHITEIFDTESIKMILGVNLQFPDGMDNSAKSKEIDRLSEILSNVYKKSGLHTSTGLLALKKDSKRYKEILTAIEILNKTNLEMLSPIRLHMFYTKNTKNDTFILTGSSGSSIITVACPHPGEQREIYKVNNTTKDPNLWKKQQESLVLTVDNQTTIDTIRNAILPISQKQGSPDAIFQYADNQQIGYLHFDITDFDPKKGEREEEKRREFIRLLINPWLFIEFCNQLNDSGRIQYQGKGHVGGAYKKEDLPDLNKKIKNNDTVLDVVNATGISVFTMTNGVESFQVTTVLEDGTCTDPIYTYQICSKTGFSVDGTAASALISSGSGWCGIKTTTGMVAEPTTQNARKTLEAASTLSDLSN